jgi:hypothetical protein
MDTTISPTILADWTMKATRLLKGYRWCVACGDTKINPNEPSYVVRCEECYQKFMASKEKGPEMLVNVGTNGMRQIQKKIHLAGLCRSRFCKKCGSDLEKDRIDWAIRNSGGLREAEQCLGCSRGWNTPVHGVLIPTYWHPHIELIFIDLLPKA